MIQQNLTIRLCLNKKELCGSTLINYKDFKAFLIRLYKQFSIMFQTSIKKDNKREIRGYLILITCSLITQIRA